MFAEFTNQVWTLSPSGVAIENNTDTSIDGSSKKITFTEISKSATLTFDQVNLSLYEEISLYISPSDLIATDLFTIAVGGQTYTFTKSEMKMGTWNHILIDCSAMGNTTTIIITNLTPYLVLFFDYVGYRKVNYNSDVDLIVALKNHINLDYGITLSLAEDASAGDTSISLNKLDVEGYITDTSVLEIDNGAGTIETVELINSDGDLANPIENDFSEYDQVRVLCPVLSEDYDALEPDPVCGIKVFDLRANKQLTNQPMKSGTKIKQFLGELGVMIYIDCRSKKKLLQMAREYNKKYGDSFIFLLDGEQVEIYMDSSNFSDDIIGNNPRMSYYYYIEPQPCVYMENYRITTFDLETDVYG